MGGSSSLFHNCFDHPTYYCSSCGFRCPNEKCYDCCTHKDHGCAARQRAEQQKRESEVAAKRREQQRQEEQRQEQQRIRDQLAREQQERERERKRQEEQRQELIRLEQQRKRDQLAREQQERERERAIERKRQEEQSQELIRLEQQRIWDQLARERQERERERKRQEAQRQERQEQQEREAERERQKQLEHQERKRQAVLSKLHTRLSSAQIINTEEELAYISEDEESTYYFDTNQTRENDTDLFMRYGSSARDSNTRGVYMTDKREIEDEIAIATSSREKDGTGSFDIIDLPLVNINCYPIKPTSSSSSNRFISSDDYILDLGSKYTVKNGLAALSYGEAENKTAHSDSATIYSATPPTPDAAGPTITEIILSHFTNHLSPEEQALFSERAGKTIASKLPLVDLPLQQSILRYVLNHNNLFYHILEDYPVSEWIRQSLIKEVVAFPHEIIHPFLLQRFRNTWSDVAQKYNNNQQEKLLYALKELHSLTLLQINDLLDLVLATGLERHGIVCEQEKDWLYEFNKLWLTPQVKTLSFTEEEQNALCTALGGLPWGIVVTDKFLKVIKDEKTIAPILDFLSFVKDKEVADSVGMRTILMSGTSDSQGNKPKKWISTLEHHLLYNTIFQLSPHLARAIDVSLFHILAATCSADLLKTFITEQINLLTKHPADFAKVLDQLCNYQVTENICAAAFQLLPNIPVTDWKIKIDRIIVARLFEASHEYTVTKLIHHIADKSPNVSFTQKENLLHHYESILEAYQAPAVAFGIQKVCTVTYDTLTNFDHFAFNHPDLPITIGSLKILKTKPISKWNKQEVQLWSVYVKPTTKTKLSTNCLQSELIAVVQRAVELYHGFSPRATQLLSILTLLNPDDAGRLAQINTGEGKSLIVAMLAAIHALEGKQVDVITTSTELSIPEVKKQRPFFELLALTVDENSENSKKPLVYKSDVLYGTAGDFQGDILRTEFLGKDCRDVRKFQTVIVDEVDSMLFDNRSHSIRLAEESPGMNHLELPLGVIWQYLHRIARHLINHDREIFFIPDDFEIEGIEIKLLSGEPWESCAVPVTDKRSFLTEQTQEHLEKLLRELTEQEKTDYEDYQKVNIRIQYLSEELFNTTNAKQKEVKTLECKKLIDSLKEMNWSKHDNPIIDVPIHLRAFARSQVPYWIKNALDAAYAYKKDAHYAVIKDRIVPVHYSETGVLQSNMIWSDGLTQFLQLKEGLSIDPEGVSTNFISNVSFFKRYGKNIYGLTGTLGGQSTQDFLREMYGTDKVIIPPYKQQEITNNDQTPYLCKELAPIVVSEERNWYKSVVDQALYHSANKRAVLVICKYIFQVDYLYETLSKQHDPDKVFSYTGQGDTFNKNDIATGEIIIATNIAGRGTDFKTSKEVEAHGGMYVAVTFLPESYRVEMQNVGRTGREGKKGMAQLILYDPANSDIQVMKQLREEQEATATNNALKNAKNVLVQDALFHHFSQVEDQFLPTVNECEQFQNWKRVSTDWDNYAAIQLDPQKISNKSKQWMNEIRQKLIDDALRSISAAEINRLTSSDVQSLHEKAGRQVKSERGSFEQRYKKNMTDNFCSSLSGHLPQAFVEHIQQGKVFEPNYSELAKKYNWGQFERKGTEETWGFWLKEKHFEDKEIAIAAAIEDFEATFVTPLKDKADQDQLVQNPYFYILKGNEYLRLGQLSDAIVCYDRAIGMDPTFSVNARYNKAQALLLYAKNTGQRQQLALKELKKAKEIILGTYRTALITFNTLISQNGCKIKTSQHVQHQLNILTEQENYIMKACDIIEKAQTENHDVKLTSKTLKEAFHESKDNHAKAIREAMVNGLINLFTVEEVMPIPWRSIIAVALIGFAQIAVGCMIVAWSGGTLGMGLISEGVSDLITSVHSAITGSFSWAAWATQKVISLAVSLISAGWNAMKSGAQAVKTTAKGVFGKTAARSLKDGWKLAGKQVAVTLAEGVAKECLMEVSKCCANKLFMEDLEKEIQEKVGAAITTALYNNPLIVNALKEDEKNGDTYWQQLFINVGLALLQERKDHVCFVMLRDIGLGVAQNKIPLFNVCSKVAGVTKMLYELTNYTDDFIAQFNKKVESHKDVITTAKNRAYTDKEKSQTNYIDGIVTSAAPPVNLKEDDVAVHTLVEETAYCSKVEVEQTQLRSTYNNLGPSTPESLAKQFRSHIANKLTASIKTNLINPVLSHSVNNFTGSIFKETKQSVEALRKKIKTELIYRSYVKELVNTEILNKHENGKKTPPKEGVRIINIYDVLVHTSNVAEAPIYVYDENNKIKCVVGSDFRGEPILLKRTDPTQENPYDHFAPMNGNVMPEQNSTSNPILYAVHPQLSEAKKAKLKDVNGLKEKIIETILDEYETNDKLAAISKERFKRFQIDSDSSTNDNKKGSTNQSIKDHSAVQNAGINTTNHVSDTLSGELTLLKLTASTNCNFNKVAQSDKSKSKNKNNTDNNNPDKNNSDFKKPENPPKRLKINKRCVIKIDGDSSTIDNAEPDEYQNHHIIHKKFIGHPAVKKSGINIITDEQNIISLPTVRGLMVLNTNRSLHTGRHSNVAVNRIRDKLDAIEIHGVEEQWDTERYALALYSLMYDERKKLRSGETDLYEKKTKESDNDKKQNK